MHRRRQRPRLCVATNPASDIRHLNTTLWGMGPHNLTSVDLRTGENKSPLTVFVSPYYRASANAMRIQASPGGSSRAAGQIQPPPAVLINQPQHYWVKSKKMLPTVSMMFRYPPKRRHIIVQSSQGICDLFLIPETTEIGQDVMFPVKTTVSGPGLSNQNSFGTSGILLRLPGKTEVVPPEKAKSLHGCLGQAGSCQFPAVREEN